MAARPRPVDWRDRTRATRTRLDIIPILAIVMLTAFAFVILGAFVDILYAYLDPRIRLAG